MNEDFEKIRKDSQERNLQWDREKEALKNLIADNEYLRNLVVEATNSIDDAPIDILRIFNGCHVFGFPIPAQIRAYVATAFQLIVEGYNPFDTLHIKEPKKRRPDYDAWLDQWCIFNAVRRVMFEEGKSKTAAADAVAVDFGMGVSKVKETYSKLDRLKPRGVPKHLIFSTIKK